MKVFHRLVGENSVYSEYSKKLHQIFITRFETSEKYSEYRVFENFAEFDEFYPQQAEKRYHEIIISSKPQLIRFDIDMKLKSDPDSVIDETYANAYVRSLREIIITTFNEIYGADGYSITQDDIIVATSNPIPIGIKASYHLFVDGYYAADSYDVAKFADRCKEQISDTSYIDNVYKNNQSFRLLGSDKWGDTRVKRIAAGNRADITLEDTVVGRPRPDKGLLLPKKWEMPQSEEADSPTDQLVADILAKYSHYIEGFTFRNVVGNIINFDRQFPTFCQFCNDTHHNDNTAYMVINTGASADSGSVFLGCRHSKSCIHLGDIGDPSEIAEAPAIDVEARIDTAMKSKERDINLKSDIDYKRFQAKELGQLGYDRTYILKAPMGMGKTKALAQYLQSRPDIKKVVFITFRRSLARDIGKKFAGFTSYMDISETIINMDSYPKLIIQAESLHRLKVLGLRVDLLIMDESESIIEQFTSGGTFSRFTECVSTFVFLARYSLQLIAMDANVCNRTIKTIAACEREGTTRFDEYIYPSRKRDKYFITTKSGDLGTKLLEKLNEGKRCVIATNSIRAAIALYNHIAPIYKDKRIKLYSSKTQESEKHTHLGNVDKYWVEYDILIYTPTISAGVSFEVKGHFHCVFGMFNNMSCGVESARQMLHRVRDVVDREYYICLPAMKGSLPTEENIIEDFIKNRKLTLYSHINTDNLSFEYNAEGIPQYERTPFYTMFVQNMILRHKSINNYFDRFIRQVKETGAKVAELKPVAPPTPVFDENGAEVEDRECCLIADAKELTKEEDDNIADALSKGLDVEQDDMFAHQKYKLRKTYEWTADITPDFVKKYNNRDKKIAFRNLLRIKNNSLDEIRQTDIQIMEDRASEVGELMHKYTYNNHAQALEFCQLLGFPETFKKSENHVISAMVEEETIDTAIRANYTKLERLSQTLRITHQYTNKIATISRETMIPLLKFVLRRMYGSTVNRRTTKYTINLSPDFSYNIDDTSKPCVIKQ